MIAFVRVVDGRFETGAPLRAMALGTQFDAEELGFMSPSRVPVKTLEAGEVGSSRASRTSRRFGDTLTTRKGVAAQEPLPDKDVKPMVSRCLFPTDSDDYPECVMRWSA